MELLHASKEVPRWHNTPKKLASKPGLATCIQFMPVESRKVILRINATPSQYRNRTYFMA